ncbi:MAG: peptide-methionine (S)-S-oxide reductase MsrA [Acidobacteria bacterium]|nr:peptide-methionine (S)-S-oxide reductase MsrA [Acidobacteriota bacterium]
MSSQDKSKKPAPHAPSGKIETATFAGGCFWCMQPQFDATEGVIATAVGYTGGKEKNPTYEQVSNHQTGHREGIEIKFDPAVVSYKHLLELFWHSIDPTQADGQFGDIGPQYRTAIYFHSDEQKQQAEESKKQLAASGKFSKPIASEILPAGDFWPAEEYHQKYCNKNPLHYNAYKEGSGRGPYLRKTWPGEKH